MRTLKSLLTLICIVLFSSTSQAEDNNNPQLNRGVKLFNEKRYAEATRLLIPLAEAENETALKLMSQAYQYGRGVPENKPKSLELLRKAAAIENDGWANYALGMFHLKGSSGAEKDEQLGLSYIERANELRHTGAFKVLEANFPGKYSLGQRATKSQELSPSEQPAQGSGEVPFVAGSVFEGKNPCPGQNGTVQILIESIQNKTSPGPLAVDATISFDLNKSKINKPVTAKYFPGQGKLVLYNAGPTMRLSDELSETLSLEVAPDGSYLSGNFVAPSTLENKENNCSQIHLSLQKDSIQAAFLENLSRTTPQEWLNQDEEKKHKDVIMLFKSTLSLMSRMNEIIMKANEDAEQQITLKHSSLPEKERTKIISKEIEKWYSIYKTKSENTREKANKNKLLFIKNHIYTHSIELESREETEHDPRLRTILKRMIIATKGLSETYDVANNTLPILKKTPISVDNIIKDWGQTSLSPQ